MSADSNEYTGSVFRVAIVGGGIGGATAAYYLRKHFGSKIGITLFEPTGRIGGRMKSVKFNGQLYETGASIFITQNQYMYNFCKQFGLETKDESADDDRLVFTNGATQSPAFSTLGGPKFFTPFRLLWHYGIQLFRLQRYTSSLIKDFTKIYDHQNEGRSYSTTAELLSDLRPEFVEMTRWTHGDWLSQKLGISGRLKEELAFGLVSNNYNQDLRVHAFVGFITLATMVDKLCSVKNGNELVPKRLVEEALKENPVCSPSSIVPAQVTSIDPVNQASSKLGSSSRYSVEYRLTGDDRNTIKKNFDYVILATPLHQKCNIQLDRKLNAPCITYNEVDHTFINGKLKDEVLGIEAGSYTGKQHPVILPTLTGYRTDRHLFHSLISIGKEPGNDSTDPVWAASSQVDRTAEPEKEFVDRYFHPITEGNDWSKNVHRARWLAYPIYKPLKNPHEELGRFVLAPGLYYINAIELAASCMETAAISGRNVALLLADDHRKIEKTSLK